METLINDSIAFLEIFNVDEAIRDYQSNSEHINNIVRDQSLSLYPAEYETVTSLYKMVESLRTVGDMIVYKGISQPSPWVGDLGLMSVSTSVNIAKMFTEKEGTILTILIPKGSPAFYISAIYLLYDNTHHEREILLLPGTLTFNGENNLYVYSDPISMDHFLSLQ